MLRTLSRMSPVFSKLPTVPPDPIFGLIDKFNKDTHPNKVNLTIGAYRTDEGDPLILDSVKQAKKIVADKEYNHEYAGIDGIPEFVSTSLELLYGKDNIALKEGRIVGVQTVSGTGALRVASEFMSKNFSDSMIYLPNPTWSNHNKIFATGDNFRSTYPYYNTQINSVDFENMVETINKVPDQSVIMLHPCAHNPTGADLSLDQWKDLNIICQNKQLFALFDMAYQGFASCDIEKDAEAVRLFVESGVPVISCQSYSKNFGLYGERVGCLSVVTDSQDTSQKVLAHLKDIIRPMYSNPPIYGARIVSTILNNPVLYNIWKNECIAMANRIKQMRQGLVSELKILSRLDWSHITNQTGMFSYTGLTPSEIENLRNDYHIYLTDDSRINVAGLNIENIGYVARAIDQVTRSRPDYPRPVPPFIAFIEERERLKPTYASSSQYWRGH